MSNFFLLTPLEYFNLREKTGDCGIEIEMEKTDRNHYPDVPGWIKTEDRSLRIQGMEYVMDGPKPWGVAGEEVTRLYHSLSMSGIKLIKTGNAGIHVHVNVQKWKMKKVLAFCYLFYLLEDILVPWCGEDRDGNLFCLRGSEAMTQYFNLVNLIKSKQPDHALQTMRYGALNMASLSLYGSIEFRSLEFNTTPVKLFKWLNILKTLVDFLGEDDSISEVDDYFYSTPKEEIVERFMLNSPEFGTTEDKILLIEEAYARTFQIPYCWRTCS